MTEAAGLFAEAASAQERVQRALEAQATVTICNEDLNVEALMLNIYGYSGNCGYTMHILMDITVDDTIDFELS